MKTNYGLCIVTCDFPNSKIEVAFNPNYSACPFAMKFAMKINKISMPKATAVQKALATWEIALMLKNTGVDTVNVYFETNDDNHRSTYRNVISMTLNTIINENYNIVSRHLDNEGMAFEISEFVTKFIYTPDMIKRATDAICDDLYRNTYSDCTYYSHFRISDADTQRLGGLRLPDVDVQVSRIKDYETFAIISTLNGEALTPTYNASSIDIMISPYEVYYRREYNNSKFEYCYFDIDNRVPYIDFFRKLSACIRERCAESIMTREKYEQIYSEVYKLEVNEEEK